MITKHMFQFHNGTINTNFARQMIGRQKCFNSTTVQLIRHILLSYTTV